MNSIQVIEDLEDIMCFDDMTWQYQSEQKYPEFVFDVDYWIYMNYLEEPYLELSQTQLDSMNYSIVNTNSNAKLEEVFSKDSSVIAVACEGYKEEGVRHR